MRFSEPPGSQPQASQPPNSQLPLHIPTYRPTVPISRKILDSCDTALDEDVWPMAFDLLKNVLIAGTGTLVPARVPPSLYLALAATLVVHPSLTTRTSSPDNQEASNIALDYLRHVNDLVGPRGGNLTTAFQFAEKRAVMTGRGSRGGRSRKSDVIEEADISGPTSGYANEKSLFNNVEDFWQVVGWAFNCSIAYRRRWDRWRLWLDFILDVLDRDITICATSEPASFDSCLLTGYLRAIGEGRDSKRKLMRAIFADGKQLALAEFSEVWKKETRLPPPEKTYESGASRRKLDLEAGEYGDYYDETDEENDEIDSGLNRSTSRRGRKLGGEAKDASDRDPLPTTTHATPIDAFGGLDSILLRQRFLALLMRYSVLNPDSFLGLETLCDLYTEFLRPLPLTVFQQFVLPVKRYLTVNDEVTLNQTLLRPLLETAAPKYDEDAVTQRVFVTQFAPFAANSTGVVDNARVSLLVEDILRLLLKFKKLKKSDRLSEAVERGIQARQKKAEFDGRKKTGAKAKESEEAFVILQCSADRMRACVGMVE